LPAFIVPFIFVLDPDGVGILLNIPKGGSWLDIVEVTFFSILALVAFAGAAEGWFVRKLSWLEILLFLAAGVLLIAPIPVPDAMVAFFHNFGAQVRTEWFGIALLALVVFWHWRMGARRTL
jgi:TRAP-type uncharacterized transport system, fused permease components